MILWTHIALASEVTLDGATWLALQQPETAVFQVPGPIWARRDVTLTPLDGGLDVRATWLVIVPEEGWTSVPLATPALRVRGVWLDGVASAVVAEPSALQWVARLTPGVHHLLLEGQVDGDPGVASVSIALAPAGAGVVRFAATGGEAGIPLGNHLFGGSGPAIVASIRPATPAAEGPSSHADVALGIVLGEGVASLAARVTWTVEQGALGSVDVDLPGAGSDLQVSGPDVVGWTRAGDRITARLGHSTGGLIRLEARWTTPLSDESVAVPAVAPVGVRRTRAALQVARDADLEPVTDLEGWTEISSRQLPDWAEGLAPGTPVGAWTAPGCAGGRIDLLKFEPTGGPPAIVDVAEWTLAASEEGRILLSGRLEVRNDRAAWLRVTPPPGARILSARVDGKTAIVAGDGADWYVPLARSVETVDGLLSFPVELVLLGSADAWRRGENRLALPTVDAPVAVTRATIHLPPGWRSRARVGEDHVVAAFSEGAGITYGLSSSVEQHAADALYQTAVNAWKNNDFDDAQHALDDARSLGADNENIRKLQGNVDLVTKGETTDTVAGRRVLEQAKARSFDEANRQEEVLSEAKDAELAGDYDKAEHAYKQAKEMGDQLQRLDGSKAERGAQQVELDAKVTALEKKKAPAPDQDFWRDEREIGGVASGEPMTAEGPAAVHEPAEPPPPPVTSSSTPARTLGPIAVAATTTSVVIPSQGEAVLIQELLLPPGEAPTFEIPARNPRSRP